MRVLELDVLAEGETRYGVELRVLADGRREPKARKAEWAMVESRVPLRLGRPLPLTPFVFPGPRNSLPDVDKMPLADIIVVDLGLDADRQPGLRFTALPAARVSA